MRQFVFILLIFFSCGRQQTDKLDNTTMISHKDTDLYALLDQLPILKTPLTFSSSNQIIKFDLVVNRNELSYRISETVPDLNVLGKIYQTEEFIAIIGLILEDNSTPVLRTFDKGGKEIDSFYMYPPSDGSQEYYSTNIVTLNENKEISSIDSVVDRRIYKERHGKTPREDSLSVTKKTFRVNDQGEIEKIG